jgi:leader peptidase (prepilin peptidase)/N-methyltransferase
VNAQAALFVVAPALALGSFVNVLAARIPLKRSIVRPGSACMACGREIAWRDNIPVVSYLALRGRCRVCGTRISPLYPVVEVATALLVAACVLVFGLSGEALVAGIFCVALVAISVTDLTHRIVPNRIVLPTAVAVVLLHTAIDPSPEWLIAALAAAAFFFAAALAYPAGLGMGDVKLALLMGAALGRTVSVALMIGMLAALVPSVVLLVRHGAKARKMGIPFAPFLALGSLVALFAGERILDAYLGLMS